MILNCSDPALSSETAETATPLIRLLRSMAAEWEQIAREVEDLGSDLSAAAISGSPADGMQRLQSFDLIQQRAHAQAGLLTRLCRKLAEDQYFDRRRVMELVADIPFEAVRSGLAAAFEGQPVPAVTDAHQKDVEWL